MTEAAVLTHFAAGAPVPEWLLAVEPAHANAVRGALVFNIACDLCDTGPYYLLMPTADGPQPQLLGFNGQGCRIYAADKPLRLSPSFAVIWPLEVDAWGGAPAFKPMDAAEPVQVVTAPKPSLLARLWAALKG